MKKLLLITFLLASTLSYGQFDKAFSSIPRKVDVFKPISGAFTASASENVNGNKFNYKYSFSDKSLSIDIVLPKSSEQSNDACDYFVVMGNKITYKGLFEEDFACDMDITSLKVYKGVYGNKQYVLITGINSGSGSFTTTIVCHLFDVTNPKSVKYYPLWSKYGGTSCFGDFNTDNQLDFLKVRNYKGSQTNLKVTLMTLKDGKFIAVDEANHYMIGQYQRGKGIKVTEKKWW